MIFRVTPVTNDFLCGDLFYSLPDREDIINAEKEIEAICREKLRSAYNDSQAASLRLETELGLMKQTKCAFAFMLVREISELSKEYSASIMLEGNLGGSIIQYLLGLSEIDPLCAYITDDKEKAIIPVDMVWHSIESPEEPEFAFEIASSIRPIIQRRLDERYGFTNTNFKLYNRISMNNSAKLELISIVEGKNQHLQDTKICKLLDDKEVLVSVYNELAEKLPDITVGAEISLFKLLRLFAFSRASFASPPDTNKLFSKDLYVTRDDLFMAFTGSGVPPSFAISAVKKGVWSTGKRKQQYKEMLIEYHVDDQLIEKFNNTTNLWCVSSCLSRLYVMLKVAWIEIISK